MTSYRQFSSRGLAKRSALRSNLRIIRRRWQMYVMVLVPFLWVLVFNYVPMYGVQIAFKDFIASNGISGSRQNRQSSLPADAGKGGDAVFPYRRMYRSPGRNPLSAAAQCAVCEGLSDIMTRGRSFGFFRAFCTSKPVRRSRHPPSRSVREGLPLSKSGG